jgi:hypothetical protein
LTAYASANPAAFTILIISDIFAVVDAGPTITRQNGLLFNVSLLIDAESPFAVMLETVSRAFASTLKIPI